MLQHMLESIVNKGEFSQSQSLVVVERLPEAEAWLKTKSRLVGNSVIVHPKVPRKRRAVVIVVSG